MKFQVVSDLHLEFEFPNLKSDKDTTLIIAGDLCELNNKHHIRFFLDKYAFEYHSILHVPGNHEYYYSDLGAAQRYNDNFLYNYPNVYLLDNNKITIDNIDILGTTLWTNFFNEDFSSMYYASRNMNDFFCIDIKIKKSLRTFRVEDAVNLFNKNKKWIESNLTNNTTIVVTHHAPSLKSLSPRFINDVLNGAYVSDLEYIMVNNPQIKYWIHGHIHDFITYKINETTVICNPKGYYSENKNFDNNLTITP
jgi:Icc-related predicted phosphoesterase